MHVKPIALFLTCICLLSAQTTAAPYQMPNAETRHVENAVTGEVHKLFIFKPNAPAPEGGYPVIYILDGNSVFGAVTDEVRRKIADEYGDAAMVVAIGYPEDEPWNPRREKDLTPWTPESGLQLDPDGNEVIQPGGADGFLSFLENIVMTEVEADYPINAHRRTLAGHSFGGLFTLHTYFTKPNLFQNYVAMSPSIWFADGRLLNEADAYLLRFAEAPDHARLLITVGGCEETPGECDSAKVSTPARDKWLFTVGRMVSNATTMFEKLHAVRGDDVALTVIDGEHHTSVIGASLSKVVAVAMTSRPTSKPEHKH